MKSVIILGAGGYAWSAHALLDHIGTHVLGCTGRDPSQQEDLPHGLHYLGDDATVFGLEANSPLHINLVNGIGSVGSTDARRGIFSQFRERGYHFLTIIHPAASIAKQVYLGEGIHVMAGAVIQGGCVLEDNVIINIGAMVDHGCHIRSHCHVAPGAVLSGGVILGEGVHVGTGAAVVQGITIGKGAIVAAGAVVIKDVREGAIVMGTPAKEAHG